MVARNLVNPLTDETQFITSMSPLDRQKTTYIHGVQRVGRWIDTTPQDVYSELMAQICEKHNASVWPNCTMHVIWCENGWREVADGVQGLERCWPVMKSNGEGRKLITTSFPQAGHLVCYYVLGYDTYGTTSPLIVPLGRSCASLSPFCCRFLVISETTN